MQLFVDSKIDFMGKKWLWMGISLAFILFAIVVVATKGIKRGVEFTGGAQLILKFQQPPDLAQIRAKLEAGGFGGVAVTTFGEAKENEVSVRVGLAEKRDAGAQADLAQQVATVLRDSDAQQKAASGMVDLNATDQVTLSARLVQEAGVDKATADAAAKAISEWRRDHGGMLSGVDQLAAIPGVADAAKSWLTGKGYVSSFALRGQELIEGSISKEMRSKAIWAMFGALLGMLAYIWIRFRFVWGLAAVVALVHDVVITLGLFCFCGYEADLPVIAAFLTLVGFSVNDTIVTFDRIRENIRNRGMGNLEVLINDSINQTLSRTVITSFTVWLTSLALFLFGGPVLNPFSFVMTVGIIVGTYSSIYIASPLLVIWKAISADKAAQKPVPGKAARA